MMKENWQLITNSENEDSSTQKNKNPDLIRQTGNMKRNYRTFRKQ